MLRLNISKPAVNKAAHKSKVLLGMCSRASAQTPAKANAWICCICKADCKDFKDDGLSASPMCATYAANNTDAAAITQATTNRIRLAIFIKEMQC